MPRIHKVAFAPEFRALYAEASALNEKDDCAVKAIAIACNVSYADAHAALKAAGRRDRGSTPLRCSEKAINALGFRIRRWSFLERRAQIEKFPGIHKTLHNITSHHLRRFPKAWDGIHQNMIWVSCRHMWAVKNGKCMDWSVNRAVRVMEIWEIEKA